MASVTMASIMNGMSYRQLALRYVLSDDDDERVQLSTSAAESQSD